MQLLQVIPITKSIDTEVLTYFSVKDANPGQLVTVPLRKKEIKAIVVHAEPVINMKTQLRGANYQIRNVIAIHNEQVFSAAFLRTCNNLKNFYATTTGRIINQLSPSFVTKNIEEWKYTPKKSSANTVFSQKILQRNKIDRISFYKTLIREKMLRKESLHIICPTIQSTKTLFLELEKNNHEHCFLLHSGLTKKKYKETYVTILAREKSSIVISTPGFLDIPLEHKSTIIIEEESSEHYRTISSPYIDLRVCISQQAQEQSIECIWADSILRPETWHLSITNKAECISPWNKKVFKPEDIQIITQHIKKPGKQTDQERISELNEKKKFSPLSKEALVAITSGVQKNEKIFLFVHKKSLAPSIVCNDCGNVARSSESGHPFSLYIKTNKKTRVKERIFICHTTGETIPAFDSCQFCNSWNINNLGIGTESVFQEIQNYFPKIETYIIDSAHAKTKKSLREITDKYNSTQKAIIIIGTQKAIPEISTIDRVIVVSLDSYFARMSHTIHPQVLSLLSQLNEKTVQPLLLQSRNILEESLPILSNGLYSAYLEQELKERDEFNYPPFKTLIRIKRFANKEYAQKEYTSLYGLFSKYDPQIIMRPGTKKGIIEFVTLLSIDTKSWNTEFQDVELWNLLRNFSRTTEVHINPKDLV
jgi:primosomal protein N'